MTPQSATIDESATARYSSTAASAGLGVLAGAIGYLVTYVLIVDEVREVFGEDAAEWKGVAWYFYNAHMVDVETTGSFGSFGSTSTVDFIAESGSTSATLLYVIPPLVLLGLGALLVVQWGVTDIGEGVVAGVPVTIGYAVVMGLGALVAETSSEGTVFGVDASGSVAPEFVPALVLGGILYPLVFTTGGAVLAAVFNTR
ncbi:hypothetical protein [Natronorubrum halophilum]|uniref:hypothetical protein n=1 Tax=Natronorubrum halophilum TaxID=1702106 RepID=UPI000EF719C0|nr:hypothetical protein [Natronorubrum halophilum]